MAKNIKRPDRPFYILFWEEKLIKQWKSNQQQLDLDLICGVVSSFSSWPEVAGRCLSQQICPCSPVCNCIVSPTKSAKTAHHLAQQPSASNLSCQNFLHHCCCHWGWQWEAKHCHLHSHPPFIEGNIIKTKNVSQKMIHGLIWHWLSKNKMPWKFKKVSTTQVCSIGPWLGIWLWCFGCWCWNKTATKIVYLWSTYCPRVLSSVHLAKRMRKQTI